MAMENFWLWILTVVVYSVITLAFCEVENNLKSRARMAARVLAWVMILCAPFNVNGNIFTVLGNATSEKNIYSVLSVYQNADGGNAFSALGFFTYQEAKEDSNVLLGITSCQKSGGESDLLFGLAICQKSMESMVVFGAAGYQDSKQNSSVGIGIAGYQNAGKESTTLVGVSGYQKAGNASLVFLGVAVYQKVENENGSVERSFGAVIPLKVKPRLTTNSGQNK